MQSVWLTRHLTPDPPDRGGAGPRAHPGAATGGPRDVGADDLGPVTSGDAANTGGFRGNPDTAAGSGGGADAGDGSIDATDATTVTGDPDVSPAMTATEDRSSVGGTSPGGGGEPIGQSPEETGYQQSGASGALGPEDVDPAAGAPEPDYGPSVTGPAAESGPKGDPAARGADTGLGGGQPYPAGIGTTNVQGPADEERQRGGRRRRLERKGDAVIGTGLARACVPGDIVPG